MYMTVKTVTFGISSPDAFLYTIVVNIFKHFHYTRKLVAKMVIYHATRKKCNGKM